MTDPGDLARSEGHVAFVPDTHGSQWEYWVRGDSVYRQNVNAPVMPDGYRSGRWYAYARPDVIAGLQRNFAPLIP